LIEKAYLIGFRLGDLNVRQHCLLIDIKTNTTKIDQINLFRKLFENYGHVYIKEYKNNFVNMEVLLNQSFSFLISKKGDIEQWILNDNSYFLAFLAGYIDTEGNIGVYCKRVRVGSYDKNLLRLIHKKPISMNIHNIFRMKLLLVKIDRIKISGAFQSIEKKIYLDCLN
jgi:intein/homing endonuclease